MAAKRKRGPYNWLYCTIRNAKRQAFPVVCDGRHDPHNAYPVDPDVLDEARGLLGSNWVEENSALDGPRNAAVRQQAISAAFVSRAARGLPV